MVTEETLGLPTSQGCSKCTSTCGAIHWREFQKLAADSWTLDEWESTHIKMGRKPFWLSQRLRHNLPINPKPCTVPYKQEIAPKSKLLPWERVWITHAASQLLRLPCERWATKYLALKANGNGVWKSQETTAKKEVIPNGSLQSLAHREQVKCPSPCLQVLSWKGFVTLQTTAWRYDI